MASNTDRKRKLNKVVKHFLNDELDFFNAYITPNNDETGYYLEFESEENQFITFLDNIYIDNNTIDGIIGIVEESLNQHLENNNENIST